MWIELIKQTYQGEPLSEDEYNRLVEHHAGTCECGGQFTFAAPSRCPNCRSQRYEYDPRGEHIEYD